MMGEIEELGYWKDPMKAIMKPANKANKDWVKNLTVPNYPFEFKFAVLDISTNPL